MTIPGPDALRGLGVPGVLRASAAAVSALLGLVVPVECPGCGTPDVSLCARCRQLLAAPAAPVAAGSPPVPVWACAAYAGPVSRCVVAWKDRGRQDLTGTLGAVLARAVAAALRDLPLRAAGAVVLVPVPSSAAARRARGADVAAALADAAARDLADRGLPVRVRPLLHQRRGVADQARLGVAGRRANVAGAFAVRRQARARVVLAGRPVVVVDDVVTTGASAAEACRVVRAHGGRVVAVATACWTPRRAPVTGRADPVTPRQTPRAGLH